MFREAVAVVAPGAFAIVAALSYFAPDLVRQRSVLARRIVAAIAAVAALFAGTEPTGVAVLDVLLAPAVAAAVTLLAARAKPWTMAGVAVGCAVSSPDSSQPMFAFAAAGGSLAIALTAGRSPVVTAVIGGAVGNAVLRLDVPGPQGTETLLGLALLTPVAVSGYRRLRREHRKIVRRAAAGVGAVVAVAALLALLAVAAARPSLEGAAEHAARGLTAARGAQQDEARREFDAASDAFAAAGNSLDAWWARPGLAIPVAGPHLRALRAATSSGRQLSLAGDRVAGAADLGGLRVRDGQLPVDRIAALHQPLVDANEEVRVAIRRLREARSAWLLPFVRDRLDTTIDRLVDAEQSLRASADATRVLPRLLGSEGPRRYFLAVQTPSEARASGGFIGNFGELLADGGKLSLERFGRTHELNTGGDPESRELRGPADYVSRYSRFAVATTWQNVTMSPDFPSVAEVISELYPQSGGRPVDGVIAVDPYGVAALLRATGPLRVPSWPEPLTHENAARVLLYEQYVELAGGDRVDFLGEVTVLLWQRLTQGELAPPNELLRALGPAVRDKHVLVWSANDADAEVLARLGVDGSVAPVEGDALAVITQNAAANKIDYFLRREITYAPRVDANGAVSARLSIALTNSAPTSGLPGYVIGNQLRPKLPTGSNRLYLSVYTPWLLDAARIDGRQAPFESELELGRHVYSAYVVVPPGKTITVELDLHGSLPAGPRYRLDLHAQPLAHPDSVTVDVNGRSRQLTLASDATLRFANIGRRHEPAASGS